MGARIIDGKATAKAVREEVRERAAALAERGVQPGLTVVLVGEDAASQVYVRNKDRAATQAGFQVDTVRLPATAKQRELLDVVERLNADDSVHGILVQLPLPDGGDLDSAEVVRALDPQKDVDGLHPDNVAALVTGAEGLVPCTPAGCVELLDRYEIPIEGAEAVVLGRSMLVGKPLGSLLLARNATVTLCHSRTRDLPEVTKRADILVAAVGRPELVRGDWIRPGAAVLDVGINRRSDAEGGGLVGDVAFEEASEIASAITPVPGGVGPMTIAMLLSNTLRAACRAHGIDPEKLAPGRVAAGT